MCPPSFFFWILQMLVLNIGCSIMITAARHTSSDIVIKFSERTCRAQVLLLSLPGTRRREPFCSELTATAARCSAVRPLKIGIAASAPSKRSLRAAVDATTTARNVTRSTPHRVPVESACRSGALASLCCCCVGALVRQPARLLQDHYS